MPDDATEKLAALRAASVPIRDRASYDSLLDWIGDAELVLLGEATHGTHEFYRARVEISRRLIEERGFAAVAVEADWPDAYRVNRFVRGRSTDHEAGSALGDFRRFPQWMWRNREVKEFIDWLHGHNARRDPVERVGFYGLDLYSLHSSMNAVIGFLEKIDPAAAERAKQRYACFDHYGEEPQAYGYLTLLGADPGCEKQVVQQLCELREQAQAYAQRDGLVAEDERFAAEQNAVVAKNAERYYREMYRGDVRSWNLRDTHMADTLDALVGHLRSTSRPSKVVVWEHNSHLGDARATAMSRAGELNVGQLVRERYGDAARLVGFTTYDGSVAAADEWDGPVHIKSVVPARPDSIEWWLHQSGLGAFYVNLRDLAASTGLDEERLERAIGVIYRPQTERLSHYFEARLSEQFDVVVHFDRTRAVEPLDRSPRQSADAAETFPTGI